MTAIDAHQDMWDPVKADYPCLGPEPDNDADTQLMLRTAGKFPQNCSRGGREVLEQVSVLPRCPELMPELSARHEARSQTIRFTGWTNCCFPFGGGGCPKCSTTADRPNILKDAEPQIIGDPV